MEDQQWQGNWQGPQQQSLRTSSHLIQAAVTGDLFVDGCNVGQIPSPEQKQHEFSSDKLCSIPQDPQVSFGRGLDFVQHLAVLEQFLLHPDNSLQSSSIWPRYSMRQRELFLPMLEGASHGTARNGSTATDAHNLCDVRFNDALGKRFWLSQDFIAWGPCTSRL